MVAEGGGGLDIWAFPQPHFLSTSVCSARVKVEEWLPRCPQYPQEHFPSPCQVLGIQNLGAQNGIAPSYGGVSWIVMIPTGPSTPTQVIKPETVLCADCILTLEVHRASPSFKSNASGSQTKTTLNFKKPPFPLNGLRSAVDPTPDLRRFKGQP